MSTNSAAIETLARHLLENEKHSSSQDTGHGVELVRVCNKLRVPLVKLAGTAGFASLLSRAIDLAARQDLLLLGLRVNQEGSLGGLDTMPNDPAEAHRAAVIVVTELLGLLVAIIGESLTRSVVGTAWPVSDIETRNLGSKEQP